MIMDSGTAPIRGLGALLIAGGMMAAGMAPSAVSAQQAERRDSACSCAFEVHRPSLFSFERARLGVTLGEPADVAGHTGVRIEQVAEGGPAARAGLREDDVVLSLDGTALGNNPTTRLIELMGEVEPGDTVAVRYARDGDERTAMVVADRMPGGTLSMRAAPSRFFSRGGNRMVMAESAPELHGSFVYSRLLRDGLEMVELNEGLGSYFGTAEGVLVVEAPEDSPLGLRPGDVILAIGDREVRDAGHARSILSSYRNDEVVPLRIMRDQREITIEGRKSSP